MTTDPGGHHRLVERARPADFDDAIDALAAGQFEHFRSPGLDFLVIDQMVCTHFLEPLELVIRRGGRDHRRTGRLGKLQSEDRDATGALHQHRVARLDAAIAKQRPPGSQSRAGQGCRFGRAIALGRVRP